MKIMKTSGGNLLVENPTMIFFMPFMASCEDPGAIL
jgi:hypothetical protein